jgi:hypothetical protein
MANLIVRKGSIHRTGILLKTKTNLYFYRTYNAIRNPISFPFMTSVAYPEIFFGGGSTNSVDRGQREQGSGGGSPLVRGSAQFVNG